MRTTGSTLNERVRIQRLDYDLKSDAHFWTTDRLTWAAASQDAERNLFSSAGIGARGVTFILRKSKRLTLYNSILWRSQFCFLTSIVDGDPGFQVVKAALCRPVECRKDKDSAAPGCRFPGILTEKYVGHVQQDPYAEVTVDLVLVTPKAVALAPGSWVTVEGIYFLVRVPHELDPYKNEYEIQRKVDC